MPDCPGRRMERQARKERREAATARALAARTSSPIGSVVLGAPLARGPAAPDDYELRVVVHQPANVADNFLLGHLSESAQVFTVSAVGVASFSTTFSLLLGGTHCTEHATGAWPWVRAWLKPYRNIYAPDYLPPSAPP